MFHLIMFTYLSILIIRLYLPCKFILRNLQRNLKIPINSLFFLQIFSVDMSDSNDIGILCGSTDLCSKSIRKLDEWDANDNVHLKKKKKKKKKICNA